MVEFDFSARIRAERKKERDIGPKFVQSFITNIVVPKSLEELYEVTRELDDCPSMDKVLYMYKGEPMEWTVPRWAKRGDVVFLMHSKTSNSHLTAMRSKLDHNCDTYSYEDRCWLKFWINHELEVHRLYGGKIFAIGRVVGKPFKDSSGPEHKHWGSNISAAIDDIHILREPIDISEFNEFVFVSRQSAITGVFGENYERLMGLVEAKNHIPKSYKGLVVDPMPLSKVNERNWFDVLRRHRRSFFLELQFRAYCVDHFLRAFGDRRTFYAEGHCKKPDKHVTFVDNLVLYRGLWLPVEVKLDIDLVNDLEGQLQQYMDVSEVVVSKTRTLGRDELWLDRVLVVDTEGLSIYTDDRLHYLVMWKDTETVPELLELLGVRLSAVCEW